MYVACATQAGDMLKELFQFYAATYAKLLELLTQQLLTAVVADQAAASQAAVAHLLRLPLSLDQLAALLAQAAGKPACPADRATLDALFSPDAREALYKTQASQLTQAAQPVSSGQLAVRPAGVLVWVHLTASGSGTGAGVLAAALHSCQRLLCVLSRVLPSSSQLGQGPPGDLAIQRAFNGGLYNLTSPLTTSSPTSTSITDEDKSALIERCLAALDWAAQAVQPASADQQPSQPAATTPLRSAVAAAVITSLWSHLAGEARKSETGSVECDTWESWEDHCSEPDVPAAPTITTEPTWSMAAVDEEKLARLLISCATQGVAAAQIVDFLDKSANAPVFTRMWGTLCGLLGDVSVVSDSELQAMLRHTCLATGIEAKACDKAVSVWQQLLKKSMDEAAGLVSEGTQGVRVGLAQRVFHALVQCATEAGATTVNTFACNKVRTASITVPLTCMTYSYKQSVCCHVTCS